MKTRHYIIQTVSLKLFLMTKIVLSAYINKAMEGKNETVKVRDGAKLYSIRPNTDHAFQVCVGGYKVFHETKQCSDLKNLRRNIDDDKPTIDKKDEVEFSFDFPASFFDKLYPDT